MRDKKEKAGFLKNKKGLVGAGIEWMISTPVIILILIVFLFIAILIFQTDRLKGGGEMRLINGEGSSARPDLEFVVQAYFNKKINGLSIEDFILENYEDGELSDSAEKDLIKHTDDFFLGSDSLSDKGDFPLMWRFYISELSVEDSKEQFVVIKNEWKEGKWICDSGKDNKEFFVSKEDSDFIKIKFDYCFGYVDKRGTYDPYGP